MATEIEKAQNAARLWGMITFSLVLGIWDMVEESSVALSPVIGNNLLSMLEQRSGLELAGEKPENVLAELGRLFSDEFDYGSSSKVEVTEKGYSLIIMDPPGMVENQILMDKGITKPFFHPVYAAGLAAMARLGIKCRAYSIADIPGKKLTTNFEII